MTATTERTTDSFADRLAHAVTSKESCLVVGLDPVIEKLPDALQPASGATDRDAAAAAILEFNLGVLDAIEPYACAVKPQIAFYEPFGPAGYQAWERTIEAAHDRGLLVIGDIKRGDIGSTAAAYASAHLGPSRYQSDAITVNPYFGTDGMAPFVETARAESGGLFVLVRTSNPTASELQDLTAGGQHLHEHVADLVNGWGANLVGEGGYSSIGAVVGATAPEALGRLRERMPRAWFLVPGVGAQGGAARDVIPAFDGRGLGAVVNASRGILYAFRSEPESTWTTAVTSAARTLRDELRLAAQASS